MKGLIAIALLGASLGAVAAETAPAKEPIPVIHILEDGTAKFEYVKLYPPQRKELITHVCIREFGVKALRCYALNTADMTWETADIELE